MIVREPANTRRFTRPSYDWTKRYPLIRNALAWLVSGCRDEKPRQNKLGGKRARLRAFTGWNNSGRWEPYVASAVGLMPAGVPEPPSPSLSGS
jgi:hypothetical protein